MFNRVKELLKGGPPRDPQTSRIGLTKSEYALHPSRGLTPERLARILEEAEQGNLIAQCDLAEDMEEKDAHIHAELSKRRRALLGLERQIDPPRDATAAEKKTADFVAEVLSDVDVDELILDMGDAIHKGFAPLEIEWTRIGKTRVPELGLKPQRWFQLLPNQPYSNDLRLRDNTADGEPLVPGGWIVHLHQAKPGYIARGALARVLSWPYLFKNYSVRDLAEFLEIYGLPLVMGTYPRGAGSKEKSTLLRAVASIGHAARGIMPEGMAIEIKEAAKGASDPFQAMTEWAERSESKAIIGQVLSSEAKATGMGSGVAALQAEVRDDIMQSDAHQIARSLSQLCMFVAVFNGYTIEPGRAPKYRLIGDDSEDLSTFADSVPKLVHVGAKIPERWIHDRLKIPEPENDEPILQTPAAAAPTPRPATASAALATQPAPEEPQTISDLQSEQLGKNLMPVMDDWIGKIRALVESADSLEAIRDGLLDLYPDLKTDDFTEAMAEALSASALAGRYDILEQAGGLG